MDTKKTGIIVLFGKPNVGKSTLFNALQKEDFAITSYKPQTTRNNIYSLITFDDNTEAVLIDTPGFHNQHNRLDIYLNQQIKQALNDATTACFIFDTSRNFDDEDQKILKQMFNLNVDHKILVINKIDKQKELFEENQKALANYQFDQTISISALNKQNIDELYEMLKQQCKYDDIDTTAFKRPSDEFITCEIIRLSCINLLNKELPYAIGVNINAYEYNKEANCLNIDADLYVEKESQKPIVIGKGASMIKKIGIESRKKLLEIYDCKINLKLFVKVKDDWRNSDYVIKSLGYK